MIKKSVWLVIFFCTVTIFGSCESGEKNSLKEWGAYCAQDVQGSYEWEGTLYCMKDGISWKHNTANGFISQYLPNGNNWTINRNNIEFVGIGDVKIDGREDSYIEIITKNSKHYFVSTGNAEENKKLVEYITNNYM